MGVTRFWWAEGTRAAGTRLSWPFCALSPQVPVPRHSVGVVIGRSGEMIKKIQNDAGVRIQFKQGQGPGCKDKPSGEWGVAVSSGSVLGIALRLRCRGPGTREPAEPLQCLVAPSQQHVLCVPPLWERSRGAGFLSPHGMFSLHHISPFPLPHRVARPDRAVGVGSDHSVPTLGYCQASARVSQVAGPWGGRTSLLLF